MVNPTVPTPTIKEKTPTFASEWDNINKKLSSVTKLEEAFENYKKETMEKFENHKKETMEKFDQVNDSIMKLSKQIEGICKSPSFTTTPSSTTSIQASLSLPTTTPTSNSILGQPNTTPIPIHNNPTSPLSPVFPLINPTTPPFSFNEQLTSNKPESFSHYSTTNPSTTQPSHILSTTIVTEEVLDKMNEILSMAEEEEKSNFPSLDLHPSCDRKHPCLAELFDPYAIPGEDILVSNHKIIPHQLCPTSPKPSTMSTSTLEAKPGNISNKENQSCFSHTYYSSCHKTHGLIFSNPTFNQVSSNPYRNFNTQVDKPPELSSKSTKKNKKPEIEEEYDSATSTGDTFKTLHALQHRGQESAGIVIVHEDIFKSVVEVGLVAEVFNKSTLNQLHDDYAIGFSTTGSLMLKNVLPFMDGYNFGSVEIAHNACSTTISCLLSIASAYEQLKGASSTGHITDDKLVAVRDLYDFQPLGLTHSRNMDSKRLLKYMVWKQTESVSLREKVRLPITESVGLLRLILGAIDEIVSHNSNTIGIWRGGRMFAPNMIWRTWCWQINLNQKRYATVSCLATGVVLSLVLARCHRTENIPELPLVFGDSSARVDKSSATISVLKQVGAYPNMEEAIDNHWVQLGKGRFVIWTTYAFAKSDSVYETFDIPSDKKIDDANEEAIQWLDSNPLTETNELDDTMKVIPFENNIWRRLIKSYVGGIGYKIDPMLLYTDFSTLVRRQYDVSTRGCYKLPYYARIIFYNLHEDERGKVDFDCHINTTCINLETVIAVGLLSTLALDKELWKLATITLTSDLLVLHITFLQIIKWLRLPWEDGEMIVFNSLKLILRESVTFEIGIDVGDFWQIGILQIQCKIRSKWELRIAMTDYIVCGCINLFSSSKSVRDEPSGERGADAGA